MNKVFRLITIASFLPMTLLAQNTPLVKTEGAMKDMGTSYDLKIWLDTLTDKSHLYGMGPYDKMRGEITIVDGKPFFASAFKEGKATVSQSWEIGSPFFVYSNVEEWEIFDLSGSVKSVQEIQDKVAAIAHSKGYNLNEAFAFKIKGQMDKVTCHIVTPRSPDVVGYRENVNSQKFTFNKVQGEIIGFYSESHQGIFTGSKSYIHVHFLKDDQTFMGHLDEITSSTESLKLYLPKRQSTVNTGMKVNDTDFSKGRLGHVQTIDLNDLVKFHGHLCDGLVVGHLALQEALNELYLDGITDRTNTRIISKPSPCLTDVAIYTTGGRYQFNTFYTTEEFEGLFVVQRIDTKEAVSVSMKKGVKPVEIDQLGSLAVKGELSSCDLDKLQSLEDDFATELLSTKASDNFIVHKISNFNWEPVLKGDFIKTDVLNKDKAKCLE